MIDEASQLGILQELIDEWARWDLQSVVKL
jgi:hypothetical protein